MKYIYIYIYIYIIKWIYRLVWDWTRSSAVRGRWVMPWVTAQTLQVLSGRMETRTWYHEYVYYRVTWDWRLAEAVAWRDKLCNGRNRQLPQCIFVCLFITLPTDRVTSTVSNCYVNLYQVTLPLTTGLLSNKIKNSRFTYEGRGNRGVRKSAYCLASWPALLDTYYSTLYRRSADRFT